MGWLVGSWPDLWHTAIKAALLFGTAVLGFRLGRRRTLAELAPFDFVAVVSIGAIVGRTATAADSSYLTGMVALVTVLLAHAAVSHARQWRSVARLIDRPPRILVHDGQLVFAELARAGLTEGDLYAALRERGVHRLADVRLVLYETRGAFSVVSHGQPEDVEPFASGLRDATR